MHVHHRRRNQHNKRPPPAPVRLKLHRGPRLVLDACHQHDACVHEITKVTRRLARCLFCGFDRWAAAVHRPFTPATVPEAAVMLGALRYPVAPLQLRVQFKQVNAYSLGANLILATKMLRQCELQDLKWLAHATLAWQTGDAPVRQQFVCNDVLQQAHADMVQRDGNAWGGLVPPQLVAMVRHGVNTCTTV